MRYYEWYHNLEFLVDNILLYLRQDGVIFGPILPERKRFLEPENHRIHKSSSGWGFNILLSDSPERRPKKIVEVTPGGIAFYERIKPIFEEAYDSIGLGADQAASLDTTLYFKCARRGPGEATVQNFLEYCERQGHENAVVSLEVALGVDEEYDDSETEQNLTTIPIIPLDERAKRLAESWGIVHRSYNPVDTRNPVHGVVELRRIVGPCRPMECDECEALTSILYISKQKEVCNKCLSVHNHERIVKHKKPVYHTDRKVCVWG